MTAGPSDSVLIVLLSNIADGDGIGLLGLYLRYDEYTPTSLPTDISQTQAGPCSAGEFEQTPGNCSACKPQCGTCSNSASECGSCNMDFSPIMGSHCVKRNPLITWNLYETTIADAEYRFQIVFRAAKKIKFLEPFN